MRITIMTTTAPLAARDQRGFSGGGWGSFTAELSISKLATQTKVEVRELSKAVWARELHSVFQTANARPSPATAGSG